MRFLSLLSLPCHEHFRVATAIVAIPLIFQVVVLAVIVILIVTAVIYLELTMCQALCQSASNLSSHLLIPTTLNSALSCHFIPETLKLDPGDQDYLPLTFSLRLFSLYLHLQVEKNRYVRSVVLQRLLTLRPLWWRGAWSLPGDIAALVWTAVWTDRGLGVGEVRKAS